MQGAVIDPVLNFDAAAGATSTSSARSILAYIRETGIELAWILGHASPCRSFSLPRHGSRQQTGAPTAIGAQVTQVQQLWKDIYNLPEDFPYRRQPVGPAVCRW